MLSLWWNKPINAAMIFACSARSLIEFLHAAILAKIGAPSSQSLELSEEEWKELKEAAELRSLEEIEMIFQVCTTASNGLPALRNPKPCSMCLLVKCATAEASFMSIKQARQRSAFRGTGSHDGAPSAPAPVETFAAPATVCRAVHNHTAEIASKLSADAKAQQSRIDDSQPTPPRRSAAQPAPRRANGPRTWEGFIDHVRKTRPLLASILEHGSDADLDEADQRLALFYKAEESYYLKQLQVRTYLDQFQSLSKEYFGKPIRLMAEMMGEGKDSGESLADKKTRVAKERQEEARSKAQNHPIIREAQSLFGGELGPIELSEAE